MALRYFDQVLCNHLMRFYSRYEIHILEYNFPNSIHLSPVRDQKDIGACAFVSTTTSIEMLYRIHRIPIRNWKGDFYFDFNEVFNHLYRKFPLIPNARVLHKDPTNTFGTRLEDILDYITCYGLQAMSFCPNPQLRNFLSNFDHSAFRYFIDSYRILSKEEVLDCIKLYPVIAGHVFYKSLNKFKEAIYFGPTQEEKAKKPSWLHAVIIVGSVILKNHGIPRQFVIVQNSHGVGCGFCGFLLMPFDCDHLFTKFWFPIVGKRQIEDGDEMIIPDDHEEYCPPIPESDEDHSPDTWQISQLVKPSGRRVYLVDTPAPVKSLEAQGIPSKHAEEITSAITQVLDDSLENISQNLILRTDMKRIEMKQEASLSKFKSEIRSSQDHQFSLLQREAEKLRNDIEKMRGELRHEIDKATAGQRLDLNLERGRIRDELNDQSAETANLTNKLDREIHDLKAQLEAPKYDVIKYCIGTLVSLSAVGIGIGMIRIFTSKQ